MGNPTTATATAAANTTNSNNPPARNSSSLSTGANSSSIYHTATSSHSSVPIQSHPSNDAIVTNPTSNSSNKTSGTTTDGSRSENSAVQSNAVPNMNPNINATLNPAGMNEYTKYMYMANVQQNMVNPGMQLNAPPPNVYPPGMIPLARPPIHAGFHMDARVYGNPPMYFSPRGYPPSRMIPQNNNGMVRTRSTYFYGVPLPVPTSAPVTPVLPTKTAPPVPVDKEANDAFFNLLKNARISPSTPTTPTPPVEKTVPVKQEPSPQLPLKTPEKNTSSVNESSLQLGDLIRNALSSENPLAVQETTKPTKNEINGEVTAVTDEPIATNDVSTPRTSEVNETSLEFSNVMRMVAHGESPPVATCEYGLEIDGFKTYTIEEMLAIRANMKYDVQKMVQTLSKFRIAERSNYSGKSVKLWKTIAEKKKLGLVSDKEVFNHSLLQILNKITAVNFYQNWATFRSLKFISSDLVVLYAELLFDKVVGEHSWSYVYSELVRLSIISLNQMHSDEKYGELFLNTLLACIRKGIQRDYDEEKYIAEMKKVTSKDRDVIDKAIAETAERENIYRKKHVGVVLFVANLYYDDVVKQEFVDEIIELLRKETTGMGIELYACMLENIALKYVESSKLASQINKYVDSLNDYVSTHLHELPSKTRFALMDLVKYKQDNFKTLPKRKRVPKSTDAPLNRVTSQSTSTVTVFDNNDSSNKRSSNYESNSFGRVDRSSSNRFGNNFNRGRESSRFKASVSDNRRPNPDAFNNPNKGKLYNKPRGMGQSAGTSFNSLRYASMGRDTSVSLDEDNSTIPSRASSITSRTTMDTKPISLLKRQSDVPQRGAVGNTNKSVVNNTGIIPTTTATPIGSTNTGSGVTGRMFNEPTPKHMPSQVSASFDNEELKEDSNLKNLEESAQTLISNFHLHETNVSRFIIDLSGYSLSDHMNILLKEAFKYYYSGLSHGHYAFGVLLSKLMSRYPELVNIVKLNLADQLVELSLNAIDEPVLWDYFYFTVLPMLTNKRITLDDIHELLAKTPDVMNADETILNMFVFGEKKLSKYDVAKLVAKQSDTKVWQRLVDTADQADIVKTIAAKLPIVTSFKAEHIQHWVDILLDVNYDASYVVQSFAHCYSTPDEGLKDVAKSLYLYSALGDSFTNDLITIFNKRDKKFMDELFGTNSSRKLLCYLAEIFATFKFTPSGAIVDIGVPLYKNDHVDKEWLNSWREQDDKPYDSSKVDPDIYKIIKSRRI